MIVSRRVSPRWKWINWATVDFATDVAMHIDRASVTPRLSTFDGKVSRYELARGTDRTDEDPTPEEIDAACREIRERNAADGLREIPYSMKNPTTDGAPGIKTIAHPYDVATVDVKWDESWAWPDQPVWWEQIATEI